MIDWAQFTPWSALLGGLLIGASAVILMAFNGRIAGISGILGTLLAGRLKANAWKLTFLTGLIAAPLLWQLFAELPKASPNASTPLLVVSGLLVGFGTRLGSGCTSGHGVCGLSRLSMRSLVATLSFMTTGFITVFITRHLLGA